MKRHILPIVGLLSFLATPTQAQDTSPQTLRLCMSEIAALNMLRRNAASDAIPPQFARMCEHVVIRQLNPNAVGIAYQRQFASVLSLVLVFQFCGEAGCIYLYAPLKMHRVNAQLLVFGQHL